MAELLGVTQLRKRFAGVVATDGVDLSLQAGEIHALIGPNGAGKTTLVHQLAGALKPDGGSVHLEGRDVTHVSFHARVHLGIARSYQITSVFASRTVEHNLALSVLARSGSPLHAWSPLAVESELFEEARGIAGEVGLGGKEGRVAGTLAYGDQRRLEIGLALATRPKVLLLDEPMAGMDPEASRGIVDLISRLKGSTGVFLVEHDMDAVFRLADRISVLVSGRIIATGAPEQIRANVEVKRAYLGDEVVA